MQSISKLPYRTQFDPDYEQFSKRIEKFNITPSLNSSFSPEMVTSLLDISNRAKDSVRDDDLEFEHSNIYVQYASQSEMKDGQKNITDHCPGCGDSMKKNVQCSFCAIAYCKNCCFRKRVIPTLSGPKDSRDECNDCHQKFVKLFANQDFYYQYTILQKIIEATNKKITKLEEDSGKKRGKFEDTEKRKKALKIKENVLEKQRQKEEKKLEELIAKKREAYRIAADKKRQEAQEKIRAEEQQKVQSAKKIREEKERQQKQREEREEQERIKKLEQEKEKALLASQQEQRLKQAERLKQEQSLMEAERQRKQEEKRKEQNERIEKLKQEEIAQTTAEDVITEEIKQVQRIEEQTQIKTRNAFSIKKAESLERHRQEAEGLKSLAEGIVHHPIESNQKDIIEQKTPLVVKVEEQKEEPVIKNLFQGIRNSYDEQINVMNSFQKQNTSKQNNNDDILSYFEDAVTTSLNVPNNEKIDETQVTDIWASLSSEKQKNDESDSLVKFKQMPQIAINVSQMTVNELLGIHVNLEKDGATLTHNKSIRQAPSYEQRRTSVMLPKDQEIQLSEQQKQMIFKKSLLTSSAVATVHDNEHEQEYVADPSGQKCACNMM